MFSSYYNDYIQKAKGWSGWNNDLKNIWKRGGWQWKQIFWLCVTFWWMNTKVSRQTWGERCVQLHPEHSVRVLKRGGKIHKREGESLIEECKGGRYNRGNEKDGCIVLIKWGGWLKTVGEICWGQEFRVDFISLLCCLFFSTFAFVVMLCDHVSSVCVSHLSLVHSWHSWSPEDGSLRLVFFHC